MNHKKVGFLSRIFGGGNAEDDEFNLLNRKLQLASLRQSKPRCLTCGNSTTDKLSFDQDGASNVLHTCGSRLCQVPENFDAPRFMYRPELIRLDSEGRRI